MVVDRRPLRGSMPFAIVVAAGSMALLGVGGWLWWLGSGFDSAGDSGFGSARSVFAKSVLFGTLLSMLLWLVWLLVVYALLQRLAGFTVHVESLVREGGLATAPLAIGLLMVLPGLSFGVGLVAIGGWVLATQAAIERATGLRGTAVLVANLAGFAVWAGVMSLLTTAANQMGPGPLLAESIWERLSDIVASVP